MHVNIIYSLTRVTAFLGVNEGLLSFVCAQLLKMLITLEPFGMLHAYLF